MERLPEAEKHEVGDVHDIIDGSLSGGGKQVAQPFGRLGHLDATHGDAAVSRTALLVFHLHGRCAVGAVGGEVGLVAEAELRHTGLGVGLVAMARQVGFQVACHAVVAGAVNAVGSEFHFQHIVALHIEVACGVGAGLDAVRKHHDAVVRGTETYLVFSAYHSKRLHAAHLRLLDDELFIAVIEASADGSHHHVLSGGYVRGAADYLQRLGTAHVDCGDVQMVGIRVGDAGQHMADFQAAETALHGFYLLHMVTFQPQGGESGGKFLCRHIEIDVAFKPL